MPKKRFLQTRPFLALGIVLGLWLILPTGLKSLARVSFYEFQAPANLVASHVRDLQEFWSARVRSKNELIEAGRDLARVTNSYELRMRENDALREEVVRLERLLNLPAREGFRYEIARVDRREFSAWWQQIVIRKGQNYGIRPGAPVVFIGGVVGRVREVHAYTSVVDLVSSRSVRLAANFEGDPRPISYVGAANPTFANPRGLAQFIPGDIEASTARPILLVTSGLGGVFPPGLPIGRVESLRRAPNGLFNEADVVLDERLSALTEVAVLLPAQPTN
ncbi:rod shape-determining protein MreC [Opitutales bacterium ASA1]|uniref:rod shape-determining protein MreC n=1 Tax=Congregicoccus parvus TaxID=3081749 RepID=UPI002B2C952F|nr:rod shape-determining protein MreC [Opitutales bacterium ASA1]